MKFNIIILFLFSTLIIAQDKASIAVLELEPVGLSHNEAQVLSNRLRTELFKTDKFTVLERDKMSEILIEQGFQLSGCTTNECVVEAGKLIGVKQMVAGNIAKIDNLFTLDIRMIDVETGKVIKTATEDCECELKDVLTNSIRNVARSLAGLKVDDKTANVKSYQTNNMNNSNAGLSEWVKLGLSREEYSQSSVAVFITLPVSTSIALIVIVNRFPTFPISPATICWTPINFPTSTTHSFVVHMLCWKPCSFKISFTLSRSNTIYFFVLNKSVLNLDVIT